ncbi:sulfite exporter TauE/SafE family protein [Actinocorallia longicatena]|uniref:Sulfite exporter TauE/SafE n=1 Tax=Actinocorallia longicatena TaxID=111803 RepID=A0ABP6QSP3_9ACTN
MSIGALFATGAGTGLLAGATTCAALHTGLLAGVTREARHPVRPVASFLGAKLASHTALGAALGLLGDAVRPGPSLRSVLLLVSALVLAFFALDLLGVPLRRRRRSSCGCDAACAACGDAAHGAHEGRLRRLVRGRGAAVMGAATVLVPCGLTLSAELLAVGSGSALAGAVVMAAFVLGTAPLSGLLGLGAGLMRGRLGRVLGTALLVVAVWTALGGLRLGGWLPEQTAAAAIDPRYVATGADGVQVVTVHATDRGYRPALLGARAGVPTVLVVRTAGTTGCTRAFEIPKLRVERLLPETGEVRVDLGTRAAGRLRFVCSAGHYPGSITFQKEPAR